MVLMINFPEKEQLPAWLGNNPFVSCMLKERADVKGRAAAVTLNDLMPRSYDNLIALQENPVSQNSRSLSQYTFYYQKVAEYLPESAAAYGTLGFCYFHEGKQDASLTAYRAAARYAPGFFWYHYNAGILHFSRGNYKEAADAFHSAVKTKFDHSLQFFQHSKIYLDLLRNHSDIAQTLIERLKTGYKSGEKMLVLSNYYLNHPEMQRPQGLSPQLF